MSRYRLLQFLRPFSTSSPHKMPPTFAPGSDTTTLQPQLDKLLVDNGGRWTLSTRPEGVERGFKFKNFAKTWDFMTAVSLQAKLYNHHPEWSNVYNTTFIRWTTHSPRGITAADISLAQTCDSLAQAFGELPARPVTCELKSLAETAAETAGGRDCCVPNGKGK